MRQKIVIHPIILFLPSHHSHVDQLFHRPIIFPSPSWCAVLCPNHVNLRFFLIWSFLRLDLQMSLHWSPLRFAYSGQSLKIVFVIFPAICNIELSKKGNIFHSTPPAWHFWKMVFLFPPCGFSGDGSLKNHSFKSTPPNEPSCCVGLGLDWSFNFNLLAWWEVKILPMAVPQQKNWSVLALGIHSVLNQKYQKQLESNVCFLIISKDRHIIWRFVKFETPFDIFETSSTSQTNSWFNQCNPLKLGTVPSKNRTWEILRTCHPPRSYEKPFCEVIDKPGTSKPTTHYVLSKPHYM